MIVKKFQGDTETEAVKKAQEELGNKAVVLNVKTVKQRGIMKLFKKDVVEITAALEEDEYVNRTTSSSGSFDSNFHKIDANKTNNTGRNGIDIRVDDPITIKQDSTVIEQKLDSLHSLLENQMNTVSGKSGNVEIQNQDTRETDSTEKKAVRERENSNMKFIKLIYKKLIDNEVDEKFADIIMGDVESSLKKESNIDSILAAAYQKIILKIGDLDDITIGNRPKVVFFIGPTGVGKTTTIAKIASRFKLEQDAKVAFVTSDTYRIAAVEQLNTYASIIDSPVSVVYSPEELTENLDEYTDYDLILVDTAGRSHKSEEQMDDLTDMLEAVRKHEGGYDIQIYLVLSITTKYKDLINITERYKDVDSWSIIFTKLDETCALGNILNLRLLTGANLSYTTAGQNVPDDIELINKQALAKQLLGGNS